MTRSTGPTRRQAGLALASAAALLATGTRNLASAQGAAYPNHAVRIVVGFPPGGPTDLMTRELARGLQDMWGQAVVPENKPGAASLPAAESVVRANPDGYTLLLATDTPIVVLPFLRDKLPFNPLTDLKPIAIVGAIPLILVASPAANVRNYAEFVAAAKARPGKLDYASNGIGAGLHIAMERLKRLAGIELNHIPYKGSGDALPALLGGQISLMWDTVPTSLPLIKAGKLLPLAMGSPERSPSLPDVPTIAELGHPGFDVSLWMGIMGPAAVPPAIVAKVQADLQTLLAQPAFAERLQARGFERRFSSSADFAKRIQDDYARNKALFAQLDIRKE
jgi:tripartite-type tricarboxylate transporter receptor subunit TctC